MENPEINLEALKAANVPDDAIPFFKWVGGFFKKSAPKPVVSEEDRSAILARISDPEMRKQVDAVLKADEASLHPDPSQPAGNATGKLPGGELDATTGAAGGAEAEAAKKKAKDDAAAMQAQLDAANAAEKAAGGKGGHLVTEDDGTKHLPTTTNGKPDHGLMGAAWAALHGGYRGNTYDGPKKADAKKKLKALYEREGMDTPAEKAVTWGSLCKGLYDVGDLANCVLTVDRMARWSELEAEDEGDGSQVPAKLKAARDVLAQILIEMTQEEVGELKMATPEEINKAAETILQKMNEATALAKKGAKFSAETMSGLKNCKAAFGKAHKSLMKAATKYPDDDDLSDCSTNMAAGMYHMSKIDFEGHTVEGSGPTDVDVTSGGDAPSKAAAAAELAKAAGNSDIAKLVEAAVSKAVESLSSELKKTQDELRTAEVEKAKIEGQLSVLSKIPADRRPATAIIPVQKGAADKVVFNNAGGQTEAAIDVASLDRNDLSVGPGGVPTNFHKALTAAHRNPIKINHMPSAAAQ